MNTDTTNYSNEAQTQGTEVTARTIAQTKTIVILATLVEAAHLVCHTICDEGSDVTTLENAKEGLTYLMSAIHEGSKEIAKTVTEFEMAERANATGSQALN